MKKIALISLIPVVLAGVVFLVFRFKTQPINTDLVTACSVDSDCVLVDAGCCGCSAGGSSTAINSNYRKEWIEKRNLRCKADSRMCMMVMSCVGDTAVCTQGKCAVNQTPPQLLPR